MMMNFEFGHAGRTVMLTWHKVKPQSLSLIKMRVYMEVLSHKFEDFILDCPNYY